MWKINTVKKIILIAIASFSIISCRKDDDEKSESTIIGTWKTIDYRTVSGKDGSIISSNTIPDTDCIRKSNYKYKNNGKFIGEYFRNSQTGECGNTSFYEEMDYSYNEEAKTITYKIDGLTQEIIKVHSLDKTEMQILVDENMDHNSDGIPDKILRIYIRQ